MELEPKFTLCFIRYNQKYLMLHRKKEPNKGKWNGVGGKIEPGEPPTEACLREIYEETGLPISSVIFRGLVFWNNEGGMYVYLAESPQQEVTSNYEGKLEWKELDWILTSPEVVSNIPLFLPQMLDMSTPPQEHIFMYNGQGEISEYTVRALEEIALKPL